MNGCTKGMELYMQFNNTVYETFFSDEQKGALLTIGVDEEFILKTVKDFRLEVHVFFDKIAHYLSQDWAYIINRKSLEIPPYLGLIAVQIYAAYLMDDDVSNGSAYGENAYNPKLSEILRISLPALQGLYSANQEVLWSKFERWCNDNGYEIIVPVARTGAHRYTQFPLSQAMLNKRDLRQLNLLFRYLGLRPGEIFHISDFSSMIRKADFPPYVTKHYLKVKERLFIEGQNEIFYRQVFNYYNRWEGAESIFPESDSDSIRFNSDNSIDFECIISFELQSLEIIGPKNKLIRSFELTNKNALHDLRSTYKIGINGCVAFVENETYEDEWINQRYIDRDSPFLLIVERNSYSRKICVAFGNYLKVIPHEHFDIYRGLIPEHAVLEDEFCSMLVKKIHVKLEGGLKLENKIWMEGAGPILYLLQEGPIWINGERITDQSLVDCKDFSPGRYAVKHRDYSPRVFYIQSPNEIDVSITVDMGWSFSKWMFTPEKFDLLGLFIVKVQDDLGPIRNWVLAKGGKFKGSKSSINITALNRASNGINF